MEKKRSRNIDQQVDAHRSRLYVDYRPAEEKPTGVGYFTRSIVSELDREWEVIKLKRRPKPTQKRSHPLLQALWHVRAALQVLRDRSSIYLSTESLIVPILVGRRSVLVVHDLSPFLRPEHHTLRNRIAHRSAFDLAVRRTARVAVPSAAVRRDLVDRLPLYEEKIEIVSEASRYDPPARRLPREKVILYVGTIEPRKNVDCVIEAFKTADLQEWRLKLVGKIGWLTDAQLKRFRELIDSPRVEYLGYQTEGELLHLYQTSEIFVYVSDSEGFGLPPLEAMSQGMAAIVSDDPALLEVADGAAKVVHLGANLVSEIQAAISSLARDEHELTEAKRRSRERAAEFSWESSAERMDSLLQACLSDIAR